MTIVTFIKIKNAYDFKYASRFEVIHTIFCYLLTKRNTIINNLFRYRGYSFLNYSLFILFLFIYLEKEKYFIFLYFVMEKIKLIVTFFFDRKFKKLS